MQLSHKVHRSYRLVRRRQIRKKLPTVATDDICRPPDWVGVGAQRSGSTWWDSLLAEHPEVHSPADRVKEVHYFDHLHGGLPQNGVQGYARFFPRPPGQLAGEWTPRYMYDAWSVSLLHLAAPDAKLLVILRDPVERYASALTLQRAWALRPSRSSLQHTFARGLYAGQLERVLGLWPADRVLVLQFEHCLRDLEGQLVRTYDFLGVDPAFVPEDAMAPRSTSGVPKVELSSRELVWLRDAYRADSERLADLVPEIDLSLWRALAG